MTRSQIMEVQNRNSGTWQAVSTMAVMAILLGSTAGCVRWHHSLREHCLPFGAERHEVNYRQCSHCGKIIPGDGFNCPNCKHVPVYHGYEPTCWRNFPTGWGCPPEHIGQQGMHQEGLLESETIHEIEVIGEPAPADSVAPTLESDIKSSGDVDDPADLQPPVIEGPLKDATNVDTNETPEPLEPEDFTVQAEQGDVAQDPAMAYSLAPATPAPAEESEAVAAETPAEKATTVESDVNGEATIKPQESSTKVAIETLPATELESDAANTEAADDTAVAEVEPQVRQSAPLQEDVDSEVVAEVLESSSKSVIVESTPQVSTPLLANKPAVTEPTESTPVDDLPEATLVKRAPIKLETESTDELVKQGAPKVMLTPPPAIAQTLPTPAEPAAAAPLNRTPIRAASTPAVSPQRSPLESEASQSSDLAESSESVEETSTTDVQDDAMPVFEVVKRIPLPIGSQLKPLERVEDDHTSATVNPTTKMDQPESHRETSDAVLGLSAMINPAKQQQLTQDGMPTPEDNLEKAPVVREPNLSTTIASTSNKAQLPAATSQKIQPRDERGLIPIRKVRLDIDGDPNEDASVHSSSDQFPQPVHRIAPASTPKPLPHERTGDLIEKERSDESYPIPVRRVKLTGFSASK